MSEKSEPITITPSNWPSLTCARKFQEFSVLKLYPANRTRSCAMIFGEACHYILERMFSPDSRLPGEPPRLELLPTFSCDVFARYPYDAADVRETEVRRAIRLLRRYGEEDYNDGDSAYTVSVEQRATHLIRDRTMGVEYNLSGRLDRIILRPQQPDVAVCRDYKFTARPITTEQALINLAVLKIAMPGYKNYAIEIDEISDEGTHRTVHHSNQMKGQIRGITERVKAFYDDVEKKPKVCGECTWCDLRKTCLASAPVEASALEF